MNAIVAMLTDPAASLSGNIVGEDVLYEPTAVRVVIAPATGEEPAAGEPSTLDWPLADLATLGEAVGGGQAGLRCATVEGDDWATLKPVVERADTETRWSSGGVEYTLRFRPLLPGESGC